MFLSSCDLRSHKHNTKKISSGVRKNDKRGAIAYRLGKRNEGNNERRNKRRERQETAEEAKEVKHEKISQSWR
jgi:hypothetical protein